MIRLKKVKKENDRIECDIYPEDSIDFGNLVVDLQSKTIVSSSLPDGYGWCKNHVNHAKNALLSMVDGDNIQEEKLVMWN